jgi:hypothetical protein
MVNTLSLDRLRLLIDNKLFLCYIIFHQRRRDTKGNSMMGRLMKVGAFIFTVFILMCMVGCVSDTEIKKYDNPLKTKALNIIQCDDWLVKRVVVEPETIIDFRNYVILFECRKTEERFQVITIDEQKWGNLDERDVVKFRLNPDADKNYLTLEQLLIPVVQKNS